MENRLQQKGLEDYKLATANASMNADFNTEEAASEVHHGMASMSLEAGDAGPVGQQPQKPNDKQAPANKEV